MHWKALNQLSRHQLAEVLTKCCGSAKWVSEMCRIFPVAGETEIFARSEEIAPCLDENDWLEAFRHHPRIGDIDSLEKKFASSAAWASGEQSAVNSASYEVLKALAEGNQQYEKKFGFIFIVCATGKSAGEMLQLLQERLPNNREDELKIAAGEQSKITQIRLKKLLNE